MQGAALPGPPAFRRALFDTNLLLARTLYISYSGIRHSSSHLPSSHLPVVLLDVMNWVDSSPQCHSNGLLLKREKSAAAVNSSPVPAVSDDVSTLRKVRSEVFNRRMELTARAGVVDGAGLLYDEAAHMADFAKLAETKAQATRHEALRQNELAGWTKMSSIRQRLEQVAKEEGACVKLSHHSLTSLPPNST